MLTTETPHQLAAEATDTTPFRSFAEAHHQHLSLLREKSSTKQDHVELVRRAQELTTRLQMTGRVVWDDRERGILEGLLDYWLSFLDRAGAPGGESQIDNFDLDAAPELPDETCPYLGLQAFQVADRKLFFGRELLVAEIASRLGRDRFVAIVGASGSGKSSIVRAGLLPALNAINGWRTLDPMVPGTDPLSSLADALGYSDKTAFAENCRRNSAYLSEALSRTGGKSSVLIIDQFEELFTLCLRQDDQASFLRNILAAVTDNSNHRVVVAIREDYTDFMVRDAEFYKRFEMGQVRLGPLGAEALNQVIREPAELVGLRFEDGIVEDLVGQVLGDPAALPLLQFTLFELWNKRSRNVITWKAYKGLGRVRDALGRRADEIFDSMLLQDQDATKQLFVRLARFSETMEVTSRRVGILELETIYPGRMQAVVQKFVQARLLKKDERDTGITVEVAHEALIRNWPRLVGWLEDARAATRQYIRLSDAAAYWQSLKRDPTALLRGPRLKEAQEFAQTHAGLSDLDRAFLNASSESERSSESRRKLLKLARAGLGVVVTALVLAVIALSYKQLMFARHAHNEAVQKDIRNYPHSILLLLSSMHKPESLLLPVIAMDPRKDLVDLLSRSPIYGETLTAAGLSKDGTKLVMLSSEGTRVSTLDLHRPGGYLRKEASYSRVAVEFVGELPPVGQPQDAGFISVGFVAGLGPVVYRGGSLTYWSNDHRPTSTSILEHLPDEIKTKAGQQMLWVEFVDDRVKVTIPAFRQVNPEYTIVLLGAEHLVSQDMKSPPHVTKIQLKGDRVSPVFSHDGRYAYLERDEQYRLQSVVAGSFDNSSSAPVHVQLQSDVANSFVPSIGFTRNAAQIVVRLTPESIAVADAGAGVGQTAGVRQTYQLPAELRSFAPSLTPFLRPPLAAVKLKETLLLAWPDQAETPRIQLTEAANTNLSARGSLLSGLEGVTHLSFDDTGRYLTALQNRWGERARVRVWDLKRAEVIKALSYDELQDEACRTAASQGAYSAFFRSDELERGVRGGNFQPCAARLQRRLLTVTGSQPER
ncbi:ATP-binding protein [Bradyrhizobium sp. CW1]|uniref:ATP-binding protein n=1 Tax=Bradyrhizobium sp. CW1 TaxID=2782686 RepID=UPI0020003A13|nr:ATP-binding protein [Bradyrhizobium sp. CW1]UPJ27801.1 ATP-binding protein [Bradyrhizobium sp. CW1]